MSAFSNLQIPALRRRKAFIRSRISCNRIAINVVRKTKIVLVAIFSSFIINAADGPSVKMNRSRKYCCQTS